jgi:xylulokinase
MNGLMGIDLGTSSIKTVIIDTSGNLLARAAREYAIDTSHPGWAEQDTTKWYTAMVETMQEAVSEAGLTSGQIQGIGLSGQMHGVVCVDKDGKVVRPAIIWADQRSVAQVDRINRALGKKQLGELTANPVATGFMLPSWLWLIENEPETVNKTAHILLPKDYLRFLLTGNLGTDPSDASGTLLFDTVHRKWSEPMLETFLVDQTLLPPIHDSSEVAGGLNQQVADVTGMRAGIPVVFGGADQPVQALSHGIIDPGWLSSTIGTGGQLLAPLRGPVHDPELRVHSFCHVLPERWYLLAATLSAGLSLRWLRDNLFMGTSYQELADSAYEVKDTEGLFFLPHLAGERTPYMDPESRGCFWGMTLRHHRGHFIRAVMEGVVFSLREGLDIIQETGVPIERVVASGGGTHHRLWLELTANVFNRPIYQTKNFESSAHGAAMLAGIGTGIYPDAGTACEKAVHWSNQVVLPQAGEHERTEKLYTQFLKLYPALKSLS